MDKKKVYIYTRVSTAMQVDGYSLDAQKTKMKAFAEYHDYEIAGEYEDAGRSGKSIEGRPEFNCMIEDIKSDKDKVSFVLVFKLSRFGRNAADVLSTLQIMQDHGVNLICVEDGIDSSKDAGKLMISVLSAVAEIERENIRVQTMEGRLQKAREGKWNGGFAPYGYKLINGNLEIDEEEAEAVRIIFDLYVNTEMGANGIAKYLDVHGIRKKVRQNGRKTFFDAHMIRLILKNPVYNGKIAYGRRKSEKIHGTRNGYHFVDNENYILAEGIHQKIIQDEVWNSAQIKIHAQAKKYERLNRTENTRTHLLSGIVKCPVCGAGMYGNKSVKKNKDGTRSKEFYYYGCKHRRMVQDKRCNYKKQIQENQLDEAVRKIVVCLVSNPQFASMMQKKIIRKVDTCSAEYEIENCEKQLRRKYAMRTNILNELDSLDPEDKYYDRQRNDLNTRLCSLYDKIDETENRLEEMKRKKEAIDTQQVTGEHIYKAMIGFEKLYEIMNEVERRQVIEALVSEIQIYKEPKENSQWIKSVKFKLPIKSEDRKLCLDNSQYVKSNCFLYKL